MKVQRCCFKNNDNNMNDKGSTSESQGRTHKSPWDTAGSAPISVAVLLASLPQEKAHNARPHPKHPAMQV